MRGHFDPPPISSYILHPDSSFVIFLLKTIRLRAYRPVSNTEAKGTAKLFMKLIFRYYLRSGAYTKDEFISLISKTAFKEYDIKEEGIGFYIYFRK